MTNEERTEEVSRHIRDELKQYLGRTPPKTEVRETIKRALEDFFAEESRKDVDVTVSPDDPSTLILTVPIPACWLRE